ncbi:MAG: polysaccharide biosynthesis tyrosine autokinase [Calditrichaeota bacterium]|nr:MAG: polysaccharide biosynthesis tyrosine autokinase [Calditrichota bacterium]
MVQKVIENLKNIISYKLDQTSRTVMTVLVKHRSPEMAALIANTLAKRFVELNREVARYKSDKIMEILENQLKIAKQELDEATQKLRAFQERYPWVRLSADAQMQIATITELEETEQKLQNKIRDVQGLLQKLEMSGNTLDLEEMLSLCNEMITLLSSSGELAREQFEYPLASVFSAEYEKLTAERRDLLASYAPTHPVVKENEQKIWALLEKVKKGARDYVNKLEQELVGLSQNLQVERKKLRRLPATSLQYAELQREHDLKERVYSTVLVRYNQNKLESEVDISDVFIIDPAIPPPEQDVLFALIMKSLMGLLISVGIGFIVAVIVEVFNKTAENVEELQEMLDIPVVGEIPMIKVEQGDGEGIQELRGKRDPKLITLDYSPTLASESYRDLRTKVLFMNQNEDLSSLMVTSLRPNEGKSLTTANLAITVAQQKISTLLIDGDLRRGVLHNTFGNKKTPGLSDFLISSATVDFDNLSKLIQPTFIPNLFLITCGSPIPNPTEMLGGDRFVAFLKLLRSRFGMVIMDTPPIQASSDAAILARYFDGVLTVIKAGSTDIGQLRQKLNEYPNLRKKVIGAVLNMVQMNIKKNQYQYSYYNY